MNKTLSLVVWLSIGLVMALAAATFLLQVKAGGTIKQELAQKQEELRDAQKASRKLEDLEKKGFELKQMESKLVRRVAVKEQEPLSVLKNLTAVATKEGIRKITFSLKKESAVPAPAGSPALVPTAPQPRFFQMKCQATYPQVLSFLQTVTDLERIVAVERLVISRQENILPYQEATFDMATYTFNE